ncbi:hypothetical protein XA68_14829 [Ophiocordyceps unilateralis]|uniref:Uncharacterized protein n=1 Tax=Ophiocordyceps unilateralis TaxID=268505 RepID=A0A2A9PMR0_OPHUN|nr:hypothetical protein XA68_14829 [Ophiocordyceps unilateralis]
MNIKLLVSASCALLVLAHEYWRDDLKLNDLKKRLEQDSRVDRERAPYYNSTQMEPKPCKWSESYSWPLSGRKLCDNVYYWVEEEFLLGTVKIEALLESQVELQIWTNNSEVVLGIPKATAILDYGAEGWGLQVRKSRSGPGNIFSRGKRQEGNRMERRTFRYSREYKCPAWHECEIRTLTWHAVVVGKCKKTPKFTCTNDFRLCDQMRDDLRCSSSREFFDQYCHTRLARECGFKVPLIDQSGKPIRQVKFLTQDRRPYITGCFKGYPWVTLSSGEVYNPEDEMYFVPYSGPSEWYAKGPDEPPPKMPENNPCRSPLSPPGLKPPSNCTSLLCSQLRNGALLRKLIGGPWEGQHHV